MQRRWWMVAALALAACGGNVVVDSPSGAGGGGAGGGGAAQVGRLQNDCAPTDGPAIALRIAGVEICPGTLPPVESLDFLIWGADLDQLHTGVTLTLGEGSGSVTQASLIVPMKSGTNVLGLVKGTLHFDTFVSGVSATGSYDLSFADGSTRQGTFTAGWCQGGGICG